MWRAPIGNDCSKAHTTGYRGRITKELFSDNFISGSTAKQILDAQQLVAAQLNALVDSLRGLKIATISLHVFENAREDNYDALL